MTKTSMRVRLRRIGAAAFEAEGGSGGSLVVDGSPEIGGEGRGMRPMEVLLTALASCSAMDVVSILRKQREPLEHLQVEIEGLRADATPSPFTTIKVIFVANQGLNEHKYQRAVKLAVEKYCSVRSSLDPSIAISWEARLE